MSEADGWQPKTRLGRKVKDGDITSMDAALNSGLPLKEPEIVDQLLPGLEDEVLDINMVQRMTDSGRRVKFRCCVVIGNRNGYVGYAEGREDQVGAAIQKAIEVAKMHIIAVDRGSGSWEDRSDEPHSLARRTTGKAGSVEVELIPAPSGLGLAAAENVRKILELAGVEDAWTKSHGNTRTTMNLAKATYNALRNSSQSRAAPSQSRRREAQEELDVEEVRG
ncbi:MAG: 30S ribosomal protein S5 [Halobacteriales archaeon]